MSCLYIATLNTRLGNQVYEHRFRMSSAESGGFQSQVDAKAISLICEQVD